MSKKYKLKKWYPSLPMNFKVGTEMIKDPSNNDYVSCDEYNPLCLSYKEVENNPEFWELVVEKDYKILSFRYNKTNKVSEAFGFDPSYEGCEHWSIHSVKRLSDGEVFTVGDKVIGTVSGIYHYIKSLEIKNNKIQVYYDGWDYLENIEHIKKPLFTTEDGIDIYEGDTCWSIYNWCAYFHTFDKYSHSSMISANKKKYFSTKEKAKEWIDNNKPQYSKKDLADFIKKYNDKIKLEKFFEYINEEWEKEWQ